MNKKIRALMERKAAAAAAARAILTKAENENRDVTAEEDTAVKAKLAEITALDARIATETAVAMAETDAGLEVSEDARIEGGVPAVAKDPKRGFKSMGDFARSVYGAARQGGQIDQRLAVSAALPSNYGNESSGADGGFAIPPEFSTNIWQLSLDEDALLPLTQNTEVQGNSMVFPKDETTPWGSSGVKAYWRAEAAAANASKPVLGTEAMRLHELMALVPVTNEQLADSSAMGSYLPPLAASSIGWKVNEAILFGTGAGQPFGILSASAGNGQMIIQAKETGQATGTLLPANISKMVSRLKTGELARSRWIGNPDILPALDSLTVGNYPIYLSPTGGIKDAPYGLLKGRPLMLSEHAAGLGSQSDLSLISFAGYRTITKSGSGIETATSMHLYFDVNAMAFRFIFRIDGKPILSGQIQPPAGKGSNTRSYTITLAARP